MVNIFVLLNARAENINIIETVGHTPGSITTLINTDDGLVTLVGDAVIVEEDLLKLRSLSVVTKNIESGCRG